MALRARARLLRHRLRPRVRLGRGVTCGRHVRLEADPGACIVIGDGVRLGDGTRLIARAGTLAVGPRSVLGARCTVVALGGIELGDDVRLGDWVTVTDFEPAPADPETPTRAQPLHVAAVRVGHGAILDHGACVLAGVAVGSRARVGAHAVLAADVPAGGAAEGAPATVRAR